MRKHQLRAGLSLLEILAGISILALVGTGLLVITAGSRQRASVTSVASRMVEVFRSAREQAVSTQTPVAVVVPSTGGQALVNTCYLISGEQQALVRKRYDFSREFPDSYLFAGHWPLTNASNTAPTPLAGANGEGFDLAAWSVPDSSHAVFCFTPAGTLVANRPEFQGAYHLVICRNATWSAGTLGGYSSPVLNTVDSPVTLQLSKSGHLQLLPGLAGAPPSLSAGMGSYTGPVTDSPFPTGSGNAPPVIRSVEVDPEPEPGTLPPGIDATVAVHGYLTLQLEATDPEGEPLQVEWESVDVHNASAPPGVFSSPVRTEEKLEGGVYRSVWEWRPPLSAVPGDQYELTVTVTDPGGASDTDKVGAAGQILTLERGTILFVDDRNGNREIYTMNSDGTNEMRLSRSGGDEAWPQLSPDGSRIMYVLNQGASSSLMTMSINGDNPTQILTPAAFPPHGVNPHDAITSCCWSPDGSRVAVIARYGGPSGGQDVYVCNADGSGIFSPHSAAPIGGLSVTGATKLTWHRDGGGERLLYTSPFDHRFFAFFLDGTPEQNYDGRDIYDLNAGPDGRITWVEGGAVRIGTFDVAGGLSAGTVVSGSISSVEGPVWSPTASSLVFSGTNGGSEGIYRVEATGANLVRLTGGSTASEASWGP